MFNIGVDIVNIERIQRILDEQSARFVDRILSEKEKEKLNLLPDAMRTRYIAKRFAGKEAVSKAFGKGIGNKKIGEGEEFNGFEFKNISILNDELGKPYVEFVHKNHINLNQLKIEISLSDDDPFAVAFVIIHGYYS